MLERLKVAHLLVAGNIGGVETLNLNAAKYSSNENIYFFIWGKGIIYEEMISRGYRCEFIGTSIGKYFKDSIKIARILCDEKIDALICHFNDPFVALCTICVRLLSKKTKIIGYVHCSPNDWSKKTIICANIIFRQAKKIICISDSVLNAVKNYLGFDDKLVRIYNGVDLSKFQIDKNIDAKTGQRLIYVGRLTEKNGVQIILRALTEITVDYYFDIIGDGDYRSYLENLVNVLGLDKRVSFYGSQINVQHFLSKADIFIHVPILEEGLGLTIVEAMANGLLCICSKSGALTEIIEDGVTGYLVEKNRPKELMSIIQKSIENYGSEESERIRCNAKAMAKRYSIDAYVSKVDSLTNEILFQGGIKIIYVGRLEKVKGVQNILHSLAEIVDIPYKFRIVGDGNYRNDLERMTIDLGLENNVEFLGSRRDIPDLLWDSDIFVHLPDWQEGFGITVVEAMAAGKICIVNNHGALPEIVTDGVDGYVISNGKRNFKETINEIYKNLVKKDGIDKIRGLQSRAIMRSKDFSIENYSRNVDKIVIDVAG